MLQGGAFTATLAATDDNTLSRGHTAGSSRRKRVTIGYVDGAMAVEAAASRQQLAMQRVGWQQSSPQADPGKEGYCRSRSQVTKYDADVAR